MQNNNSLTRLYQIWKDLVINILSDDALMARRVTIMLDDNLEKKLRTIQSKMIIKHRSSVSLSSVINEHLEKSLK